MRSKYTLMFYAYFEYIGLKAITRTVTLCSALYVFCLNENIINEQGEYDIESKWCIAFVTGPFSVSGVSLYWGMYSVDHGGWI